MRLAQCAAHPRQREGGSDCARQRAGRRQQDVITAIVTLAALPAHACWDEAAARYQRQQRVALRDRAHRIGTRPAGRWTQPQRHARHRAHADQLGLAAHAGRPRHRRARSLRPLHQHPRRRLDPRRQRPAPGLHVGCGRRLQRRQSRACAAPTSTRSAATCAAPTTARIALATAPPVPPSPEATTEHRWSQPCPDRSPEHFPSTQPRDTTP